MYLDIYLAYKPSIFILFYFLDQGVAFAPLKTKAHVD